MKKISYILTVAVVHATAAYGQGISFREGGGRDKTPWTLSAFSLGLIGKHAVKLPDAPTVFSTAGIDCQLVLSAKEDGEAYENESCENAAQTLVRNQLCGKGLTKSLENDIKNDQKEFYNV
jgi:hypothetical protein